MLRMKNPNVEYRPHGDVGTAPWTEAQVKGVICNPCYVGFGPFTQVVPDEQWVAAALVQIKREGAEQFLVNMLAMLRASAERFPGQGPLSN
jgi:hypothetical protein